MHCNKKVGAMSHRLHPPLCKKILPAPLVATDNLSIATVVILTSILSRPVLGGIL